MTTPLTIQAVELCSAIGQCMSSPQSYASRLSGYQQTDPRAVAAHALKQLEAARAKDIATHEKNIAAIEINKTIAARIEALMAEVGMPKSYSERDQKSRARYPKPITHQAGYILDIRRHCIVDDGFTYRSTQYESLKRDYTAYAARAEEEGAAADRKREHEAERALEKRKADMELAALLLRYQLPIESTWSDVLEALCGKHQRLSLAVAMQLTRGDWSEGPYRVHNALNGFRVETNEDKDIANDILECLSNFEDGRVFRDTTWNYNRLFASVEDEQLRTDCQMALQRGSNE